MDSWKQNLKMNHPPIRNHAKELVPNNCSCSIKRLSSLVKRFCTLPAKMDSNPFCLLQTTLHRVIPANWHIFWHFIWHFWHWLYSDNLSAIHSDTLSDMCSGVLSGILFGILSYSIYDFFWHIFWHSIWIHLTYCDIASGNVRLRRVTESLRVWGGGEGDEKEEEPWGASQSLESRDYHLAHGEKSMAVIFLV